MREEARLTLDPEHQRRADALAARYGWSGLALVAWLLQLQLEEDLAPTVGLAMVEMVHGLLDSPRHDTRVRPWPDGKLPGFTLVRLDDPEDPEGELDVVVVPPIPGKATYTVVSRPVAGRLPE